jgi:hypothetical protein|eukprot:COSAG02_NODE_78_length_40609_cov_19.893730_20_plen_63_part_00
MVLLNPSFSCRRIWRLRRDRRQWLQWLERVAAIVPTTREHRAGLRRVLRVDKHTEHLHGDRL